MSRKTITLIIAPLLIIAVAFGAYFRTVLRETSNALLAEKVVEKQIDLDLLCFQLDKFIELDNDWGVYDYAAIMTHSLEYLDELPHTFAALYDKDMNLLTSRTSESAPFDPLTSEQFIEDAEANETGNLIISYNSTPTEVRDMHVYFRWVPTDTSLDGRFLTVVAISKVAVTTPTLNWAWGGAVALILLTLATNITILHLTTSKRRREIK
jgi:hypothetical protein